MKGDTDSSSCQIQTGFLLLDFVCERERNKQIIFDVLFSPGLLTLLFQGTGDPSKEPVLARAGSSDCCLGNGHRCACVHVCAQELA